MFPIKNNKLHIAKSLILAKLILLAKLTSINAMIGGTRFHKIVAKNPKLQEHSNVIIMIKKSDQEASSWCSGTIVSERYILTAAHCFVPMPEYPSRDIQSIQQVDVIIGAKNFMKLDRKLYNENGKFSRGENGFTWSKLIPQTYDTPNSYMQKISVNTDWTNSNFKENIIIHEHWLAKVFNGQKRVEYAESSDLALIRLPEKINFSATNTKAAKIYGGFKGKNLIESHSKTKSDYTDRDHFKREKATVVGFGWYDIEGVDGPIHRPNFQEGNFKIDSTEKSKSKIYFNPNYSDIFTAEGLGVNNENVQVCKGDSGGPIYITLNEEPVQIGVTIATDSKCKYGYNEFISTKDHVNWIRRNVKKGGDDIFVVRD